MPTVGCELGEILDLSATGCKLQLKGRSPVKAGQVIPFQLAFEGGRIKLQAQVRWVRRVRLIRVQIGLMFVGVPEKTVAAIGQIAKFGFVQHGAGIPSSAATTGSGNGAKKKSRTASQSKPRVAAMVDLPDYYSMLHVPKAATAEQIKTSYRRLVHAYHPDSAPDGGDTDAFTQLREAYTVLMNPTQRQAYDQRRFA